MADKGEMINSDRFSASRLKIDIIINRMLELLDEKLEKGDFEDHDIDKLERLTALSLLNRAKIDDLKTLMPARYRKILKDNEILTELKTLRSKGTYENFPAKGPKGPREAVSDPPESDDDESEAP